jgi:excisionase family DNA binding protein
MQVQEQAGAFPSDDVALVTSPNKAMRILDCGRTRLYQLIDSGELETYLDGRSRKITLQSIHAYVKRKLEASRKAA